MRKVLALLLVLAVSTAFAQSINWDQGIQQCQVLVQITIPAWAQVICQDPDGITFSSNNVTGTPSGDASNNGGGDYFGTTLNGYYAPIASGMAPGGCDSKASTDPWAGAEYITSSPDGSPAGIYYQALDYAAHYIRTNTNITGTVAAFNALSDGAGHSIPAWFSLCFCGPFFDAGAQAASFAIPFDGQGGWLNGAGGTVTSQMVNAPVALTAAQYVCQAPAFGTIGLHVRILRKGMMDVAGNYSGTITISYM